MSKDNAVVENPLGTQPIKSMIWKFAIPGIISQLVNSMHNIVDQIFAGWGIGDLGIAATNIAFPLATITTALSVLYGSGAASRFSILLGEKETGEAQKTLGNALTLMILSGVIIVLCAIVFLKPMLYLFGVTELIMPYAEPYALIISMGIPFGIFSAGMSYFIRADGNPNYSSIVLLSGAIFNIIFDPIFLFVFKMGIEGIALATVLGQVLSSILALYYLLRKFKAVTISARALFPRAPVVRSICALGAAAFTTHLLSTIVQIIQMNTLKHYGALSIYGSEVPIAASGAVGKIMIVFMSCVIGISLGCQPLYGFNFGSKKYNRVKETYLLAIRYGTTVAIVAFLCLQLFTQPILSIFGSSDPLFYEFATRYIRIFMFMLFVNALQPITSTFFTSIGKANLGFCMAIIRQGLLLIPLLLLLPRLFGIDGVFFAGPITDGIAAVMVVLFAIREIRKLTKMQLESENFIKE